MITIFNFLVLFINLSDNWLELLASSNLIRDILLIDFGDGSLVTVKESKYSFG